VIDRELLRRLPKTDLHCHLDGSVRPETALELARKLGHKVSKEQLRVGPSCRSLKDFLDVFDALYPLLRTAEALERIAYELIEDCAAENIRHVEVRFAPELNRSAAFSTDEALEAALRGLRRGLADFGTTSSVIVCLLRSHTPEQNRRAFASLKKFFQARPALDSPSVVALDLAGDEARYPTMLFADFYEQAERLGFWTTCHAGETEGTANLRACLDLSVMRIGHGTHLLEDQTLMKEVVARRVPLEIGLSSNVRTKSVASLEAHPARRFHDAGVAITFNTDDRGIIGIDLTHEYEQASRIGFTFEELCRISLGSVDHVFLPPGEKAKLKARFEHELLALR
jgi:adenosine deaminase